MTQSKAFANRLSNPSQRILRPDIFFVIFSERTPPPAPFPNPNAGFDWHSADILLDLTTGNLRAELATYPGHYYRGSTESAFTLSTSSFARIAQDFGFSEMIRAFRSDADWEKLFDSELPDALSAADIVYLPAEPVYTPVKVRDAGIFKGTFTYRFHKGTDHRMFRMDETVKCLLRTVMDTDRGITEYHLIVKSEDNAQYEFLPENMNALNQILTKAMHQKSRSCIAASCAMYLQHHAPSELIALAEKHGLLGK